MARPKGSYDVSPVIRGAFLKGFKKYCRSKGIGYSDAFKEMIEQDGLGYTIDRVSKFTVKESKVDVTTTTLTEILEGIGNTEGKSLEEEPSQVRH